MLRQQLSYPWRVVRKKLVHWFLVRLTAERNYWNSQIYDNKKRKKMKEKEKFRIVLFCTKKKCTEKFHGSSDVNADLCGLLFYPPSPIKWSKRMSWLRRRHGVNYFSVEIEWHIALPFGFIFSQAFSTVIANVNVVISFAIASSIFPAERLRESSILTCVALTTREGEDSIFLASLQKQRRGEARLHLKCSGSESRKRLYLFGTCHILQWIVFQIRRGGKGSRSGKGSNLRPSCK